jgi:8-oxo-dGTP diphosphatase
MKLSPEEYLKSLPRKKIAAAAIFFNEKNELLIVKPNYRDHWLVPGGIVEKNESPAHGCIREVKEEISLIIHTPKFVGVNYVVGNDDEGLHFVFYCGVLTQDQTSQIKIQAKN